MRAERCPHCGKEIGPRQPRLTVDIIIELEGPGPGVVLIERKNYPYGWAIPGGFVDYGETVEEAALREAREETGLDVQLRYLLGVYSDPGRDPRGHTVSCVFVATAQGTPRADDDAKACHVFSLDELPPSPMAFDHGRILRDYLRRRAAGDGEQSR
ncbi:MAG: NUDIX hydrolase [candidate division KSB1 bacterium]|nr:NUDIX hydrolase [candidate division KSB1 bacterium]